MSDILLDDVVVTALGNVAIGGFIIVVVWFRRERLTALTWIAWLVGVLAFASGVSVLVAVAFGLPILGH